MSEAAFRVHLLCLAGNGSELVAQYERAERKKASTEAKKLLPSSKVAK